MYVCILPRGVQGSGRFGFGLNLEPTRFYWVVRQQTHHWPWTITGRVGLGLGGWRLDPNPT